MSAKDMGIVPTGQQRPSLDLQIDQVWIAKGSELLQVGSLQLFLLGISSFTTMFFLFFVFWGFFLL